MAGTFYRVLIIYLAIGMSLHLAGFQTTTSNVDPVGGFIDYDPLTANLVAQANNYTGLNSNFSLAVQPDRKIATGVFGFIDTLASVFNFIVYLLTGIAFSPILLFSTYKLPVIFTYLFGGTLMFGLIMGIIAFIRSGLSP